MNCDRCGSELGTKLGSNLFEIRTHVRSARVSMLRGWSFCSTSCRDTWWSEATDESFKGVSNPKTKVVELTCSKCDGKGKVLDAEKVQKTCGTCSGKGKHGRTAPDFWCDCDHDVKFPETADRNLVMDVYHNRVLVHATEKPNAETGKPEVTTDFEFECPCKINDWWKAPGPV